VESVALTRAELLERRARIALARQGCDLLKRKRDALLLEFMDVVDETLRLADRLERECGDAAGALEIAKAVDGAVAVRSAAMAAGGSVHVDMKTARVMGVAVPTITQTDSPVRDAFDRGYGAAGGSARMDEAAEHYERILDALVVYADVETRLRRLGEEIRRTGRRVNALDQVTIPGLEEQVAAIGAALDERAREDLFRLKKVKRRIERRKEVRAR
jgi:V/A-type H+-transporting ATPase subunit D